MKKNDIESEGEIGQEDDDTNLSMKEILQRSVWLNMDKNDEE